MTPTPEQLHQYQLMHVYYHYAAAAKLDVTKPLTADAVFKFAAWLAVMYAEPTGGAKKEIEKVVRAADKCLTRGVCEFCGCADRKGSK